MKTVVVIPTYNEAENIERLIAALSECVTGVYLVVVDDSPNNLTAEIVSRIESNNPQVHLIKRVSKGGRGSAVIDGFRYGLENLNGEVFVEMDADFSHDPRELPKLLEKVDRTTVVIGSRYLNGSKIVDWPLARFLASKLANLIIKMVLKMPIIDNTNGYRVYSKEAIEVLIGHNFISKGFILLSETAKVLHFNGFSFVEIPITFINRKRGASNATLAEYYDAFKLLFEINANLKDQSKKS